MSKRKRSSDSEGAAPLNVQADEADFPRGGGSLLSAAEILEARSQAEAEHETERKGPTKKRGATNKKHKQGHDCSFLDTGLLGKLPKSVDIFRYKNLSVRMKIWGVIVEFSNKDIVVSLPGGLRGFVRAEQASDLFTGAMESRTTDLKGLTFNIQNGVDEVAKRPSLREIFSEGQLVPCTVIKLDLCKGKRERKPAKRIELSLKLGKLNDSLTIDAIYEGMVLWGYVISVEDHGYLLSFGVPAISGFLLNKDYQEGEGSSILKRGQLVQSLVASIDKKRGMVMLKGLSSLVSTSVIREYEGLTLDLLVPGSLVNARVRAVLKNGLLLSFLTYFTGTVDIFHLENPLPSSELTSEYSENQRLKARILYIDPVSKSIGLTLNSCLVQNVPPVVDVNVGEIIENAVVYRLDPTIGLLLKIQSENSCIAGYVHISNVSDDHIDRLEDKFKKGRKVRGRVIGYRQMDGLAVITLKDSQVNQLFLSYMDVRTGMKVKGEVIAVETFGAIVKLADGLTALCPLQHMSEYQRSKPSAKFKAGAMLNFRVLACNDQAKKITLTHKKTMIQSKLPMITSYEDAIEDLVTHGFISGIEDYGCFVCFYNDVKGLAHRTELGIEPGTEPRTSFRLGEVVKCRVLKADPNCRRISLSFIVHPNRLLVLDTHMSSLESEISVGIIVSGFVNQVTERVINLDIPLSKGYKRAIMHVEHLTDTSSHMQQLKSVLFSGYKFDKLLVLEHNEKKVAVSAKYSLLHSATLLPSEISQLHPKSVIPGYIANITSSGCFVRFLGGLTGLATMSQLSDSFVHDPSEHFFVGQSVRAHVLEVNEDSGRSVLSLKQSLCYSTDASLLQGYFLEEEKIADLQSKNTDSDWPANFVVGNYIEGEIQDIKDYGVIVNLLDHKDVVGFMTHYQAGSVQVGTHVKARILDVVKADGIVDLTLRSELLQPMETKLVKGKHKRKMNPTGIDLHQKVQVVVELVKDEYLVLSLPEHGNLVGFASTHDYNVRKLNAHELYTVGQRLEATVQALPEDSKVDRLLLLLTMFSDPDAINSKQPHKERKAYRPGSLIKGEVVAVHPLEVHIKIGKKIFGRVHITEVDDDITGNNPLDKFSVGQEVSAKVIERSKHNHDGRKQRFLQLSTRPSVMLGNGKLSNYTALASLAVNQVVTGFVKEVTNEWAWLLVSSHVKGRLSVLDSSTDPLDLKSFKERFQIGQPVRCRISKVDQEKGILDLSLLGLDDGNGAKNSPDEQQGQFDIQIKKGDILGGRVAKVYSGAGGLSIQISSHLFGRVHVTHLHDSWRDNPSESFQEGQFVRCYVLDIRQNTKGNIEVDLSLRNSHGGFVPMETAEDTKISGMQGLPIVDRIDDLRVGMEVHGFVKNVSKKGCFVTLSPHVDAIIFISNLSEKYIDDPLSEFPPGKLVKGRILSVEPLSGRVDMTLKCSRELDTDPAKKCTFDDFHSGDLMSGVIRRIERYGLFVKIDQSDVVGMCHISEVSNIYINSLENHYKIGDNVRVKVLKIDKEKKHVFLGMKDSYFKDLEQIPTSKTKEAIELDFCNDYMSSPQSCLDTVADAVGGDDEKDYPSFGDRIQLGDTQSFVPPLDVDLDMDTPSIDNVNMDENLDIASKDLSEEPSKLSKRAKKRKKEEREAAIAAVEQRRLEGDQIPENVDDFEKLVHASPNSSFVWIKYMAFMLSLAEVDKARAIAERALKTINYREEGEKMNVWIAYLNLENVYGNPPKEAALQLFHRALQYCDPKKLYLAMLGICERSEHFDMSDELLKTMCRKFRASVKVRLRQIQYLLKRGIHDAAHKALDRALLSIPRHKHIKLISQAAILEFKIGSAERARSMFEGILRNYPKRTDLWNVYIDQEICLGNSAFIRALFERATCLDLPARKIKSLFKKYLDYEKSQGDEERIRHVKQKAMEYVESKL